MKILLTFAALMSLSGCATGSRQAEARALFDTPPRIEMREAEVEVPLIAGQGGRRYVPLTIHGKAHLFMVDTGAVVTVVSDSVARQAGIVTIPLAWGTLYGGGGGSAAAAGIIDEVRIEGVVISRVAVFFTDLTEWNARELAGQQMKIGGILGSDLLDLLGASLDYTTNTLKLRRRPGKAAEANPANGRG